ncbi:MAG: signal peptide peptidase SppA [Bryobacteraceae bacterium]|nr:signal peptide peptidase SppA [Bryobacteraceae bacterium]
MRNLFKGVRGLILGLLIVLAVAAVAGRYFRGPKSYSGPIVLEWQLGGIPEESSEDPLQALSGRGSALTLRDYLDTLQVAGDDPNVSGLLVTLGAAPVGVSTMQDLREAITKFRAKKKFVYGYSESYGGLGNYYLASSFDRLYLLPSGEVSITGIFADQQFIRGTLDKLGVQPHFEGRFEYKNARDYYMEKKFTPAHREATDKLVGSLFEQIVKGVAAGRGLTPERVKELIDQAPHFAAESVTHKLIDELAYRDQVYEQAKKKAGAGAKLLFLSKYHASAKKLNDSGTRVALIYGVGAITSGRSASDPLMGESTMGSDTVAAAFRQAMDDRDVKAIVFRVDSPGGSAIASDVIGREVQRARQKGKPVIISMGAVAASGGYWVSMDADRIVAQPGTITGSIGVVAGKFIMAGLFEKLGLSFDAVKYGQNSSMYDAGQDFSPTELERFRSSLDRIYENFTSRVAAGRKLPKEKVLQIAKGRVWSGEDAFGLGLVDELGGFNAALNAAKRAIKLKESDEIELKEFPKRKTGIAALVARFGSGESGDNSDDAEVTTTETDRYRATLQQLRPLFTALRATGLLPGPQGELLAPSLSLRY